MNLRERVLARTADRLVVPFTQVAPKQPIWFRIAIRRSGSAALAMCMATALAGWQAPPDAAPAMRPATLPDHKVLPNDLLSVAVFDEPELSGNMRVDAEGMIQVPIVTKKLPAAGLMPREIEKEISGALVDGQILLHPLVTVSLLEYAERSISVVGDVKNPGQFSITGPISLLEALAKAGWVTSDAAPDVLLTTPSSSAPRKINLQQLQMATDRSLNVTLTGGEVIDVPDARKELVARFPDGPKVWITGSLGPSLAYSVAKPADASVLKAIASAGGLGRHYPKTAWIYRRDDTGNRREVQIPLSDIVQRKAQDVALQPDDVLLIPDDDTKKMQQYYDTHPLTPPWENAQ
jgi:polysaccharide export outer membrane protein